MHGVYAAVCQSIRINQGLSISKSCISKKNLIVPRLELAAAYMASNLVSYAVLALNTGRIRSVVVLTDNIIALCLLNKSLQRLSKKLSRSNILGKLAHSH